MNDLYPINIFKQSSEILDFLEDEVSKKIFQYRLLANLTGDPRYIYQMHKELGLFPFQDAYEMYQKIEEDYSIYSHLDVLSFIETRGEKRSIVFFGAGHDAELYYSLLDAAKISVDGIIDNEIQHCFHGVEIFKPGEYKEIKKACIIITSYKNRKAMFEECINLGVPKEYIFVPDVNALYLFSCKEYFDETIWHGRENEIFVDAGAYNLSTAYEFTHFAKSYQKIYAFEPDPENYMLCQEKQKKYQLSNLEIINAGLWNVNTTLTFQRGGDNGTGTAVTDKGDDYLTVVSLDEVLRGEPCTLIKMDIEGSEFMALQGAKKTIQNYKPRLAICLYHNPMDLIEIPLYIKEIVPEYKLKIRHYSTYIFDTVLYAYT